MNKEKIISLLKEAFFSFLWIGVLVFIADIVTKQVVLHNMNVGDVVNVIPHFFYFQYVINDGMAFGINFNINGGNTDGAAIANKIIFISVSVIGAALISFFYFRYYRKSRKLTKAGLALMLAGCLGNLVDRIFYTQNYLARYASGVETYGVVDFLAFDFGSYSFPRFNIADASLVIGTLMLIVLFIYEEIIDAKARRKKEEATMPAGKIASKDEQIINDTSSKEDKETENNDQ